MSIPGRPEPSFAWVSPTIERPQNQFGLLPGVTEVQGHVAVRTEAVHKLGVIAPIHSRGLERVDDHDWELFQVSYFGTVGETAYVWGNYVEGMGFINVQVPLDNVRFLSQEERRHWSSVVMGMHGSHSDKLSYTYSSGVESAPDRLEEIIKQHQGAV